MQNSSAIFLLAAASLAFLPAGDAASVPASADQAIADPLASGAISVSAVYSGSVLFIPVGEVSFAADIEGGRYAARSSVEAAGLAALFTDFEIHAEVEGALSDADQAVPERYGHIERTGDKVRSVEVSFADRFAVSDVEPPFGSWGVPPASEADRTGVVDPMTAFFQLSHDLAARTGADGCEGALPVFDGKARYNLNLENAGRRQVRTRAWRGEAVVCHAYYEPISGYDPEDYPSESELRHPLTLWLAPIGDGAYYLPVRIYTRAGFGGVTIEAVDIRTN